jgi:hypothetical protein
MSREESALVMPSYSIALDGAVACGPFWDRERRHQNFNHHEGVVRSATMSTAMQVYFALKTGLMRLFRGHIVHLWINDTDQDTALAVWLLLNWWRFVGVQSNPRISRLLSLNDRWDITGGAFPMALNDSVLREINWVFGLYTALRRTGGLIGATEQVLRDNIEGTLARLDRYFMGDEVGREEAIGDYEVLHESRHFKVVDEKSGLDARLRLFAQGLLSGYVSIIGRKGDLTVYTIGRSGQWDDFDPAELYPVLNRLEGSAVWGGSDDIGGCRAGSRLSWHEVRDAIDAYYRDRDGREGECARQDEHGEMIEGRPREC